MNDLLRNLNPQQQQAVMAATGPVLVLAGPGSGKTRVLTQRIAYLIGNLGIRPYQILAVTFTNKAAREMGGRVENLLGQSTRGLTLGTFHAICAKLLRREAEHLPFSNNYVIFDADDQLSIVKRVIKDMNINDKLYRPYGVHASISNAKNELLLPDDFPVQTYRDEVVKRVYEKYQQALLTSNALDFDDLLLWTAFLLEREPAVREKYARRYEHILVDEFQDTNMAQYTLLKHLASFHRNIFVVGDPDQSVYRWRGADYRNVLRFEEDFSDAQVILLEENYRSTQTILDTAMAVIDRNPNRKRKELFTQRGRGQNAILHETYDDREQAAYVVDTIAKQVARNSRQPGDFAVMYRTNAQSRVLEEAFLTAGLPYKLVGAQRFYGRREIKDVIAYLRLVHNPNDQVSLDRVINTPTRGIGNKTQTDLRIQAQKLNLSPGDLLIELAKGEDSPHYENFTKRAAVSLARFGKLFSSWVEDRNEFVPRDLMDKVLDDVGYRTYIDDGTEEGRDRWENVTELRRLAAEYKDEGLEAFLENVALVSDQDTLDEGSNVPTLLTLHAAKGLEFPVVFIVGLNDGTLPHIRSFEDPEAMQEERRLFYVGITRAENQLYLLHSLNRYTYGYAEPADPSRFLADIPFDLLDDGRPSAATRKKKRETAGYEEWTLPAPKGATPLPTPKKEFDPGMKVEHQVWGEGLVLTSKLDGEDEVIDVFFDSVGLKRVIASMAKLEIKA
jgi:DNA helicase-2/ATP-dependent DNA helicase PcrA